MGSRVVLAILLLAVVVTPIAIVLAQYDPSDRYRPLIGRIQVEHVGITDGGYESAITTLSYAFKHMYNGRKGVVLVGHGVKDYESELLYPLTYQPSVTFAGENFIGTVNMNDIREEADAAILYTDDVACSILIPDEGCRPVGGYYLFGDLSVGSKVCRVGISIGKVCDLKIIGLKFSQPVSIGDGENDRSITSYYVYFLSPAYSLRGDSGGPYYVEGAHDLVYLVGHHHGRAFVEINGSLKFVCIALSVSSVMAYLHVRPLIYLPDTHTCG